MKSRAITEVTRRPPQTVPGGTQMLEAAKRTRSWKSNNTAAAAKAFFARPRRVAERELLRELCSGDPYQHRRAAEVARLVSLREPGVLAGCGDLLSEVAAAFPEAEWQARGYVLVAAAHNAANAAQRQRLLPTIRERLRQEERAAVRAMALEALLVLGARDAAIRNEALEAMEDAQRSSIPAMRARAKKMMPKLRVRGPGSDG